MSSLRIFIFLALVLLAVEGSPLGTVLFSESDAKRNCYGTEEIALITARMMLEDLVPDKDDVPQVEDNQYVTDTVDYFRLILEVVRNRTTGKGRHVMLIALTDALGGYMNKLLLPAAKYAFYAGKVNYDSILKLYELFGELKAFLRTGGQGWAEPPRNMRKYISAQELKIPGPLMSSHACSGLIFYRKYIKRRRDIEDRRQCNGGGEKEEQSVGTTRINIPMPFFDSKTHPSAMAVPFKVYTLRNLESKSSAFILIKFYVAARKCLASQAADKTSVHDFESDFAYFVNKKVSPHLGDEKFYAAFGGVLRIVETLNNRGVRASSEAEYNKRVLTLHSGALYDIEALRNASKSRGGAGKNASDGKPGAKGNSGKDGAGGESDDDNKKKKNNIILFAALITIFFWFLIGAFFLCCKLRAAKKKGECPAECPTKKDKSGSSGGTSRSVGSGRSQRTTASEGTSTRSGQEDDTGSIGSRWKNWLGRCVPSQSNEEVNEEADSKGRKGGLGSKSSKTSSAGSGQKTPSKGSSGSRGGGRGPDSGSSGSGSRGRDGTPAKQRSAESGRGEAGTPEKKDSKGGGTPTKGGSGGSGIGGKQSRSGRTGESGTPANVGSKASARGGKSPKGSDPCQCDYSTSSTQSEPKKKWSRRSTTSPSSSTASRRSRPKGKFDETDDTSPADKNKKKPSMTMPWSRTRTRPPDCTCGTESGKGDTTSLEDTGDEFATGNKVKDRKKYFPAVYACHTSLTGKYRVPSVSSTSASGSGTPSAPSTHRRYNMEYPDSRTSKPVPKSASAPPTPTNVVMMSVTTPEVVTSPENASSPEVSTLGNEATVDSSETRKPLVFGYDFKTSTEDELDDSPEEEETNISTRIGYDEKPNQHLEHD